MSDKITGIKTKELQYTIANDDNTKYYITLDSNVKTTLGATDIISFYVCEMSGFILASDRILQSQVVIDGNSLVFVFTKGLTFSNCSVKVKYHYR